MLKPCACWILVLLCFTISAKAQNLVPDSTLQKLQAAPNDTNKVMLYWKTGVSILYEDGQAGINYFRAGVALGEKLDYARGTERCLSGMAFAFSLNSRHDSALLLMNRAMPWAKRANEPRRITLAYINMADAHSNLSHFTEALRACDSGLIYAEKLPAKAEALGHLYGIISKIYLDQQQYTPAQVNLEKSIQNFEKTTNRRMVAQLYSDKADLYNLWDQPDKALPWLQEAVRIGDSLNDMENLAAYHIGFIHSYMKLKRYDDARTSAKLAIQICEETGNERQKANVYIDLAEIEQLHNNHKLAIDYAEKGYAAFLAQSDTLHLQIAANNLAESYEKLNNPAQAYKYLKISRQFADTLYQRRYNAETARLQNSLEVREKDKEIQLLNKEKELQVQRLRQQQFLVAGAILVALLVLAGAWLLYNRNKLRQRMKELELRNRIAADLHDEVGSSLSSIHMLSEVATLQGNEGVNKEILVRMSSNAKETMDRMGDIVWMIKPGETEAASLKQRMERFAYEMGITKNIDMDLDLEQVEQAKLNMQQRKNIWLIFKEAVNNSVKYSGTEKMEVAAAMQGKQLAISIKDHGKGFDGNLVKKGNGLDNMQNRAKELMATLIVDSKPETGTTVQLTVPV